MNPTLKHSSQEYTHTLGEIWGLRYATDDVLYYKARLVAKNILQVKRVDYHETFALVATFITNQYILAIKACMDMEMNQIDVKTAFLDCKLKEDIYKVQPKEFAQLGNGNLVCKLKKSLHGLKQSPRAWYQKISSFLFQNGFTKSIAGYNLYLMQEGQHVVIYVDDLIILAGCIRFLRH